MKKPNNPLLDFVIAGAARSGTTHLHHLCNLQPDIFMAQPVYPEPKFFTRKYLFEKGLSWYEDTFFKGAKEGQICGEKSVEYIESKVFPQNAKNFFPDLKIIIMLRNPIGRAISNYWRSVKNGFEKRSFKQAIEEEVSTGIEENGTVIIEKTRPFVYVGRSLYYKTLLNILEFFPISNLLILDFEDYKKNIQLVIKKLESFLNVGFPIFNDQIDKNPSPYGPTVEKDVIEKMQELFTRDIEMVNKDFNMNISLDYRGSE